MAREEAKAASTQRISVVRAAALSLADMQSREQELLSRNTTLTRKLRAAEEVRTESSPEEQAVSDAAPAAAIQATSDIPPGEPTYYELKREVSQLQHKLRAKGAAMEAALAQAKTFAEQVVQAEERIAELQGEVLRLRAERAAASQDPAAEPLPELPPRSTDHLLFADPQQLPPTPERAHARRRRRSDLPDPSPVDARENESEGEGSLRSRRATRLRAASEQPGDRAAEEADVAEQHDPETAQTLKTICAMAGLELSALLSTDVLDLSSGLQQQQQRQQRQQTGRRLPMEPMQREALYWLLGDGRHVVSGLRELVLDECGLPLEDLAAALRDNDTLTSLSLLGAHGTRDSGQQLDKPHRGGLAICSLVGRNKTLETLRVSADGIGEVLGDSLAAALAANRTLQQLELRYGQIEARVGEVLAKDPRVKLVPHTSNEP